jgi:2-polyprenyl-3-methyl-5-hydroxy-6-metoxy-1,4-benzoquinol methylase
MSDNRLHIVKTDDQNPSSSQPSKKQTKQEIQAKLERIWLTNPQQFNPERNCFEKERIKRTSDLIDSVSLSENKNAVDLGCGLGFLSRKLHSLGWRVDAVDAANNALKSMSSFDCTGIELIQDTLPQTKLKDDHYALVLSTEVIGFLNPADYRIYFSELSRLVAKDGYVICSTLIDVDSEDGVQQFGGLVETEFQVHQWLFGYHRLWLKLKQFFNSPAHYIRASQNRDYRDVQLAKRKGFAQAWFKFNSRGFPVLFWKILNIAASPLASLLNHNRWLLLKLEKISKFVWDNGGISHVIFLGQRRHIEMPTKVELVSVERKGKHQVWE